MKKSVFFLTAALSFGVAAAQQAPAAVVAPTAAQVPTLTDVPAGHWAKDAIDRLVARGVLLGYPDGTFRGTQNLTRYEAAIIIARLLNQIGNGQGAGLDAETLASLQNAVQELSADLAALGVRVNDLEENAVSKEDFSRLEERVEALDGNSDLKGQVDRISELSANYDALRADVDDNASSIAALNDLTVLLNQDILNLQDRASALEAAQADFVTRTDFDALSGSVKSIDGRVTTLENAPKFSISGSLEGKYGTVNLTHNGAGDFDLDLLNQNTFIGSYFSNDTYCPVNTSATRVVLERNNKGVRCVDTGNNLSGIDAIVTFGVTNLKTLSGAVTVDSAHVTLQAKHTTDPTNSSLTIVPNNTDATGTYAAVTHADVNGSSASGVKFGIAFDDGNNSNSNFKFNDYLFANDNDTDSVNYRRGVKATVDASALSSLAPKILIVAGNSTPQGFAKSINGVTATYPNTSVTYPLPAPYNQVGVTTSNLLGQEPLIGGYFGVRATINPFNFGTVGLNYAQGGVLSDGQIDALASQSTNLAVASNPLLAPYASNIQAIARQKLVNARRNAVGVDADLKFGPVVTQALFVASYPGTADANLSNADKAVYVKFGTDISGIKLNANYHYIAPAFEDGIAGMSANDAAFYGGVVGSRSSAPFGPNEDGFGIDGSFNVGPFGVGAYVNSFKSIKDINFALNGARQTAYGIKVGSSVWRGASLTGFYNDAHVGDVRTTELFGNDTNENNSGWYAPDGFDWNNTSSYGVALHHDGKAADALVRNLNINAVYARLYDDVQSDKAKAYKYDDFVIAADYTGKFGIVNVTPFLRYHYFSNPNSGQAFAASTKDTSYTDGSIRYYEGAAREQYSFNSYKVGIQATTDALDVTLKPSMFAGVSYRNTSYDQQNDPSTELLANVGVSLNQFLFDGSKLSVGYSYYQGFNVDNHNYYEGVSRSYSPFSSGSDVISGSTSNLNWLSFDRTRVNRTLSGVYGQWEAWGLKAAYGFYRFNNLSNHTESTAQAFKVSAKLNF